MATAPRLKDFIRGKGPEVYSGYRRGDSWVQTAGEHVECAGKVHVIGPGWGPDDKGRMGNGVLLRCGGCLLSWVIR